MRRLAMVMVLAGFAALGVAQTGPAAQAKPNFAGTWKLNLAKSDLGQMAPNSETCTITQTADEIKVTTTSKSQWGSINFSFAAKLDGTDTPPAADAFPADSPFRILNSKAEWIGSSLAITQATSFQGSKGTVKSTYTLSEDGKTLTKATHMASEQGAFDTKSVYDKA